jgi:outer membrane receptor protein involved in Fe transport
VSNTGCVLRDPPRARRTRERSRCYGPLLENRLTVNAGLRWDHYSIDDVTAFSPQTSVTLSPWSSGKIQLGWGQYAQFPEISQLDSNLGSPSLLPERSTQAIAAIEQRIGARTRHSRGIL